MKHGASHAIPVSVALAVHNTSWVRNDLKTAEPLQKPIRERADAVRERAELVRERADAIRERALVVRERADAVRERALADREPRVRKISP